MDIKENKDFLEALMRIYKLDIVPKFLEFLQGEQAVLFYLVSQNNEGVLPSELSTRLNVTRGRITAIINSLRRKRCLTLVSQEKDRRTIKVFLTKEGLEFINNKIQQVNNFFNIFVEKLQPENIIEFSRLLNMTADIAKDVRIK